VEWIEKASKEEVDIVSFPEASLPGYMPDGEYYEKLGAEALAAAENKIIEASERLGIAVVVGTAHWEDGELFNSLLAVDKGGVVRGRYAKVYLAEDWPQPGKSLPVYVLAGVKSCFLVCHDIRYPELVRLPAVAGAQICFFSSHESGLTSEHKLSAYHAMPIARATENTIFLVMANSSASPTDLSGSHGNSKIVNPDGNILEEAGHFEERLVIADIDLSEANRMIAAKSVEQPNTMLTEWLKEGSKKFTKE
jgi:predicted amidohydrolase